MQTGVPTEAIGTEPLKGERAAPKLVGFKCNHLATLCISRQTFAKKAAKLLAKMPLEAWAGRYRYAKSQLAASQLPEGSCRKFGKQLASEVAYGCLFCTCHKT